ncbi:hypothetical protein [Nostoc sp.]|uniref:hypothetical protein n=1 Tax=Nostoc sp. TaxID=1180 RepID=UPI002FF73D74
MGISELESCDVSVDGEDAVFWLLAGRMTDSSLGSARQTTVFNSVRNIPSIKLMY